MSPNSSVSDHSRNQLPERYGPSRWRRLATGLTGTQGTQILVLDYHLNRLWMIRAEVRGTYSGDLILDLAINLIPDLSPYSEEVL